MGADEGRGLAGAGFYYICLDSRTGAILGFYYHQALAPHSRARVRARHPCPSCSGRCEGVRVRQMRTQRRRRRRAEGCLSHEGLRAGPASDGGADPI